MAHFLGHGQVVSPDPSSIKNISPFYVHPRSASSLSTTDESELLTLEIMNESKCLQKEDIADLMKNDIFIATEYWHFATQIRNYYLLWKLFTGDNSFLSKALGSVVDHIKSNHPIYLDYINNEDNFVVSFLQGI